MRLLALLLAFAVSSAAAIETKVIKDVPYKDDVISQSPYEHTLASSLASCDMRARCERVLPTNEL